MLALASQRSTQWDGPVADPEAFALGSDASREPTCYRQEQLSQRSVSAQTPQCRASCRISGISSSKNVAPATCVPCVPPRWRAVVPDRDGLGAALGVLPPLPRRGSQSGSFTIIQSRLSFGAMHSLQELPGTWDGRAPGRGCTRCKSFPGHGMGELRGGGCTRCKSFPGHGMGELRGAAGLGGDGDGAGSRMRRAGRHTETRFLIKVAGGPNRGVPPWALAKGWAR